MKIEKAFLNTNDQSIQDYHVNINEVSKDGITAVYIDAFSDKAIDSEFGAGIEMSIPEAVEWMADYRKIEFWCVPAFGTDLKDVPGDTQGFIYKKDDGLYGVVLPVVSEKYKCTLKGTEEGLLQARLYSWYEKLNECKALAYLYGEGENPYEIMEKCAKFGLELLNNGCRPCDERRYPEIFEYIGWCSWDAFEIRVTEDDIIKKCQEFKDKNIPIKWAIIDDMWGEVHNFYDVKYKTREEMFLYLEGVKQIVT